MLEHEETMGDYPPRTSTVFACFTVILSCPVEDGRAQLHGESRWKWRHLSGFPGSAYYLEKL